MKRQIATLLIAAFIILILPVSALAAEDSSTANPGITPDSWLYGLDSFMKELQLFFTSDTVQKAGLLHDISEERLAEARLMIAENKAEYGVVAMEAYKKALEKAVAALDDAILKEKDIEEVLQQFSTTLVNHREWIPALIAALPEEQRESLQGDVEEAIESIEVTIEVGDIEDALNGEENPDGDDLELDDGEETEASAGDQTPDGAGDAGDLDAETEEEVLDAVDTEEPQNAEGSEKGAQPLKKVVTIEVLAETYGDEAADLYAAGELNLRQLLAVAAMAAQSEAHGFEEVLEVFREVKGIGATAKALGLTPREALHGIKETFKETKRDIKDRFSAAKDLERIARQAEELTEEGLQEPVSDTESEEEDVEEDREGVREEHDEELEGRPPREKKEKEDKAEKDNKSKAAAAANLGETTETVTTSAEKKTETGAVKKTVSQESQGKAGALPAKASPRAQEKARRK